MVVGTLCQPGSFVIVVATLLIPATSVIGNRLILNFDTTFDNLVVFSDNEYETMYIVSHTVRSSDVLTLKPRSTNAATFVHRAL